jgi:hypothetical protein
MIVILRAVERTGPNYGSQAWRAREDFTKARTAGDSSRRLLAIARRTENVKSAMGL